MSGRPISVLQFAVSAPSAQLVEPPAEIRNNGFATGTRPPAQWLNYMLGNVAQWIDRLRGPSRASWTRQTIGVSFVAAAVDTLTNDTLFANPARRVVAITDGGSNTVQASVRGDSWVGLNVEPSASIAALTCICTTNDGWFLGGENFAGTSGVICSTLFDPDGTSAIKNDTNNWTLHTLPASTLVVNAIACRTTGPSAGDAAAITAAKIIFRSGPTTWANATLTTAVSGTVLDVHDTGAAWLAVTSSGQVYRTSTPSGSWAIVTTLPATNKWRFASDGLGKIVAYRREDGGSADWYVSTDHGLTWGVLAAPFEVENARRVRFVDGTWFCCSSDFPYLSESNDLVQWNRIAVPIIDGANHRLDDVLAIDEGLVAIGQGFWLLGARGEAVAPGPWSAGPARLPIADAGYLQGRAIDSTAPSNGQTLVWDAGLLKWKPGAGGGGSSDGPPTGPEWYDAMRIALATPSALGGDITTGIRLRVLSNRNITGAKFYWAGSATTIVVKVWKAGSLQTAQNLVVGGPGDYVVTFSTPVALATGTTYALSIYDTNAAEYTANSSSQRQSPEFGAGWVRLAGYAYASGDAEPTTGAIISNVMLLAPLF